MLKFLFLFLALPLVSKAGLCEPTAEVRDALKRPAGASASGHDRAEFAQSVLASFPDDLWVNRAYQDSFRRANLYAQEAIDEYRAALSKHPGDPEYLYLYARVLIGTKTPEAIELLNQALVKDSNYAPAHLSLAEIYRTPNFKDAGKAEANLKGWMSACPNQFDGFHLLERMDDAEFVRTSAARLRNLIAGRTDNAAVGHYRTLWTLEFQSTPAPEFPRIRDAIRADLAKLRELDASANSAAFPTLRSTLREGYKLAGDSEGSKWVEAKYPSASASPSGMSESMKASQDWQAAHPYPKMPAGGVFDQAAYDARNQAFLEVTAEWIAKWPDDYNTWSQRVMALQQNRGTPDSDVERAAQGLRKTAGSNPGYTPEFRIASLYMQRNMHLEEIPDLVKRGLANLERLPASSVTSDLYPLPPSSPQSIQAMNRIGGYSTLFDAYLKVNRTQDALDALSEMQKLLDQHKPDSGTNQIDRRMWGDRYSEYWNKMGQLAEKQGHKLDALTYFQNQIRGSSMPAKTNYITRQAKTLWTDLGGTAAAWETWLASVETAKPVGVTTASVYSEWSDKNTVLPAFRLEDLSGKSWMLSNLQGKVTLVNLWATWCGPCRQELPLLQKLYEKVKDRSDIQVVTFNTDDNPGLIDQFMKENKYTFPVLPARAYVDSLVPSLSIPRNWLVNKEGVLKRESVGFGVSSSGDWIDRMLNTMVKAN